jgi:hypothetical protein
MNQLNFLRNNRSSLESLDISSKNKDYSSPDGQLRVMLDQQRLSKEVEELSPINKKQGERVHKRISEYLERQRSPLKELSMDIRIQGSRRDDNGSIPLNLHEPLSPF